MFIYAIMLSPNKIRNSFRKELKLLELRPYQTEAVERVHEAWASGARSPCPGWAYYMAKEPGIPLR